MNVLIVIQVNYLWKLLIHIYKYHENSSLQYDILMSHFPFSFSVISKYIVLSDALQNFLPLLQHIHFTL